MKKIVEKIYEKNCGKIVKKTANFAQKIVKKPVKNYAKDCGKI